MSFVMMAGMIFLPFVVTIATWQIIKRLIATTPQHPIEGENVR